MYLLVDGLNGPAAHISDRVNLAIVAKADPARLGTYAQERGWANLRLLSSRNNTFNRDYHGETPEGEQLPVLNVFSRDADGIHHRWASELTFTRGDNSPLDHGAGGGSVDRHGSHSGVRFDLQRTAVRRPVSMPRHPPALRLLDRTRKSSSSSQCLRTRPF